MCRCIANVGRGHQCTVSDIVATSGTGVQYSTGCEGSIAVEQN